MIVARIGQQRAKPRYTHASGEDGPQPRDRGAPARWPVEINQDGGIDPVKGLASQHSGHELYLNSFAKRQRGDQLFRHPLNPRGMAKIGVPMDDPRHVEEYPSRPGCGA